MQTTSTRFQETAASTDRTVVHKVTVTLPGGIYPDLTLALEQGKVDRAVTTDRPAAARLVAGYPAASASFTLSGLVDVTDETKTAAWLFDPWNADSPLFRTDLTGTPIVVESGFAYDDGDETLVQFTGTFDDYAVDYITGTVTVTCIDGRTELRGVPNVPPAAAVMDVPQGYPPTLVTCYPGLTADWILDQLLRANGIDLCPPPRPDVTCVYASLAGSAYPQVYREYGYPVQATTSGQWGWQRDGTRIESGMQFVPGFWHKTVCRDVHLNCSLADTTPLIALYPGGGFFLEFWVNLTYPYDPIGEFNLSDVEFSIEATDGSFGLVWGAGVRYGANFTGYATSLDWFNNPQWAFIDGSNGYHNLPVGLTGWHQLSVQVNFGGTVAAMTQTTKVYLDGVVATTWTENVGAAHSATTVADDFNLNYAGLPMDTLIVTNELNGLPTTGFVSGADVDASLNQLTAVPDLTSGASATQQADPWAVIQQMCNAELAYAGLDEHGRFQFKNRLSIASGPIVRTLTTRESIKTIQARCARATTANWVRQNISQYTRSTYQAVWKAPTDTVYVAAAKATTEIDVVFSNPVVGLSTLTQNPMPNGGPTPSNPFSGLRSNAKRDGTGTVYTGLTVFILQTSPTTCRVLITNPYPFPLYLVTGSGYTDKQGTPCLQLGGEFMTPASAAGLVESQWPPDSEGGAAANPDGPRVLQLPDSPFMQNAASGQSLTDDTLADLVSVRPQFQNVAVVADPSLQLLDRVQLQDPDGNGLDEPASIVGIHLSLSKTDMTQSLDLRALSSPGGWLMGVTGRSEMGVATYV